MKKKIVEYEVGEQVDVFLLIKTATKGLASNGKPFLTVILQDPSGDIEAKLWDVSPEVEKQYVAETIVKVAGDILNYKGRIQLRVKQIRVANENEVTDISDFVEKAPIKKEDMVEKITQYIFEMRNPNIQRLTRHLLNKHQNEFLEYPASRQRTITSSYLD